MNCLCVVWLVGCSINTKSSKISVEIRDYKTSMLGVV